MKINIKDINFLTTYQGYLWISDETEPIVLNGERSVLDEVKLFYNNKYQGAKEFDILGSVNPFVIEGQLCNEYKSISIKFVDGHYLVYEYDLNQIEGQIEEFIPNRMPNVEKLLFKRVWRRQSDPLCCGMDVMMPAELVFVGFKR